MGPERSEHLLLNKGKLSPGCCPSCSFLLLNVVLLTVDIFYVKKMLLFSSRKTTLTRRFLRHQDQHTYNRRFPCREKDCPCTFSLCKTLTAHLGSDIHQLSLSSQNLCVDSSVLRWGMLGPQQRRPMDRETLPQLRWWTRRKKDCELPEASLIRSLHRGSHYDRSHLINRIPSDQQFHLKGSPDNKSLSYGHELNATIL